MSHVALFFDRRKMAPGLTESQEKALFGAWASITVAIRGAIVEERLAFARECARESRAMVAAFSVPRQPSKPVPPPNVRVREYALPVRP